MNEIILEISAFFIAFFCYADSLKNRKEIYLPLPKGLGGKIRSQHFVYLMLLVTLMISSVASVLEVILEKYLAIKSATILFSLNEMYFLFHTLLSFMFTLYIINMTGVGREKSTKFFLTFLTPFFIGELLIVTNPVTKMLFYMDQDISYCRGPFMWALYAIAGFYVLLGVVFFSMYKNRLSKMDRGATLILISIAILGIVIQGIWSITVELFFESIGFLGFMLLLEDKRVKERSGKSSRINRRFIIVICLIFSTVIAININLIYHAGSDQTGKIGTIQVDNIKGDLQETISEAEGNLLRFSMGMEQLLRESASLGQLERYIREQKAYNDDLTGGNCYNVYAACPEWTIIPDFDMPEHYHAVERVWYIGAKQNEGTIYISEPYIDAATGELCFTLSTLLADGKVVTAMDFTLSRVQESIMKMSGDKNQTAMIVSEEGTIVGCSDTTHLGKKISDSFPEYLDVFERVKASQEHRSFRTNVGGTSRIIFSNETGNGWQMILSVDVGTFYAEIYRQMIMLSAIDILMVVVIVVFYMVSVNNQEKAENTLATTEKFISNLSGDLRKPVDDIVQMSDRMLHEQSIDLGETIRDVRDTARRLEERMENLFSYSNILRGSMEYSRQENSEGTKKQSVSSRYIRIGIISILFAALLTGLFLCIGTTTQWGATRISKEADKYNAEVTQWMLQQQSILRMFTDVIAANPAVLDDYDAAVKWLNDIGQNYSEMSFCYMANPYKEHTVIMNNGWVPEPDYRVEERQWYIDTERSGDGYSISSPYYDSQTGLYCITFSRIVYSKGGEFLGIFAIDCFIDKLIDILDDSYSSDGYAFLVDQDGNIINHPDKQYEMSSVKSTNVEDTEYAESYHKGSVFGMKDYDGRFVSCCVEKSKLSGFTVIAVQSWWSIYGTVLIITFIFLLMLVMSIIAVARMISRFISWQEETNEKLVEAAQTAVSAGKAKSQFLAQMSHEIRTPINAVLGMNEMILRESKDMSIREYAGNIQSAGKTLLGLINSILDFSKIEEGKMEIISAKYDTVAMLDNIIHSISQRAEEKGLDFRTHIDEELPSALYGDDMRVSQVVINLLTNAVKYTKEGSVDLYVTSRKKENGKISLGFRVKDTGIGIREEDLNKLFESFTRLDETKNRNIEGTGLGMAIVHRLLDMMGSRLEIQSEYGVGSDFSFEVVQEIVDQTPIGDYKSKSKALLEETDEGTYLYAPKARVLVVDDNEMNLKVLKNLLKLNGIKPDLAGSGEAALTKMKETCYDVILLDHMMPQMDGIETLHKAKEDQLLGGKTTVIALTANAVVGAKESYLAAGFDDYLSKPVEIKNLEQALGKYLPVDIVSYKKKSEEKEEEKEQPLEFSPQGGKELTEDIVLEFEAVEQRDEDGEGNTQDAAVILQALQAQGIKTGEGLRYCAGDEGFYLEMLSDYESSVGERRQELEDAFAKKDWQTYAIKVHALKSTAKTIGDMSVYERAKELEQLAKDGNGEEIGQLHPALMKEFKKSADCIRECFS